MSLSQNIAAVLVCAAASARAFAGVATSGGEPSISVLSCGDSLGGSTERGKISLYVRDPRVTDQPLTVAVGAAFEGGAVRFRDLATNGGSVAVTVETEPSTDGLFHGQVTVGQRSAPLECTFLADKFRKLPDQDLSLQYRVGGTRCWANGQCGGFVGSLIPRDFTVTLRFDAANGSLHGVWSVEEDAFGETVVITTDAVKFRGKPTVYQVSALRKGATRPSTMTVAQDLLPEIRLESPLATADAAADATFWVEMSGKH